MSAISGNYKFIDFKLNPYLANNPLKMIRTPPPEVYPYLISLS